MSKIIFQSVPVVCVVVEDEKRGGNPRQCRGGVGFFNRFLQFRSKEKLSPVRRVSYSAGRSYCGFFTPEDAAKIEVWLKQQGVKKSEHM